MKRRILVTGGLGYVGGRVVRSVLGQETCQVRLTTRKQDLPTLPWLEQCEVVAVDLLDETADLAEICQQVDCILHFAALNELVCAENPVKALQVNGVGSLRLLNAAIKAGVKRFIYFSTAHVYGAPLAGHLTEQSLPRPAHPYAITHKVAEDFVLAAHDKKAIEGIVVRLSNSFGPPVWAGVDRWTLLLNELAKQCVLEKKITLKSAGLQYRDFITLTDVCRAVVHLIDLPSKLVGDGLFNLGGEAHQVIEMVEKLQHCCQHVLNFTPFLEKPSRAVSASSEHPLKFDCNKLLNTGFSLQYSIESELKDLLLFCAEQFGVSQ